MKNLNKIIILLIIVVSAVLSFTGCVVNGNLSGMSDYYYEASENYLVGDTELTGTVENIEINWMLGNVTVLTHTSNTVSISETSKKELTEETKLHYWLENTTLHVKFLACGK